MFVGRLFLVLTFMGVVLPVSAQLPEPKILQSSLVFEPNRGQASPSVSFLSRSNGHSLLLKETEAVLAFANPEATVRMTLVGQNPTPWIEGVDLQPGISNYFLGDDPSRWLRSVPHFAKVKYNSVYPGIDLIYYGTERQLEYDFVVHAQRDPAKIQMRFRGAEKIAISPEGDLVLTTPAGEVHHRRPVAFQRIGNVEKPVEARFVLRGDRVGFQLGRYNHDLPLTIDPKMVWSSYLGATGVDAGYDVTVDAGGNAYFTGLTETVAVDPPAEGTTPPVVALQTPIENSFDAFVTKLDPTGALVYSTYFGGNNIDEGHSLAVDGNGRIYVVGYTKSGNFPIVDGFQKSLNGVQDAWIARLETSSGGIEFSSFLGGGQSDRAYGVAVDAAGNAYVAGATLSSNFPVLNAFQPRYASGLRDGFITKVTPGGTVAYSTFLGGAGDEEIFDIGVDVDGNIVVTGFTSSQNFPVANPVYRNFRGGNDDIFISKLNSAGNALVFSTYFGGGGSDNGVRLTLDKDKNIYVTGYSTSLDFPVKNAAQVINAGSYDAFLIKLHPDGQDADFSTLIGGEDVDGGTAIAVGADGYIYLSGFTNSLQFYAINAVSGFLRGARDGFLIKMESNGGGVVYSTYLGDFGTEAATSVAVDGAGNAYVTGFTTSTAFPVATNAFQPTFAGAQDAFILKINGDDVKTNEPFAFPANGGARTATAGQTARTFFGHAAADVGPGQSPSGLEIVDLRSGGTLLSEVSIPVPPLLEVGRFFVRTEIGNTTAVTIVNPNDAEASIDFYFTSRTGVTSIFGNFKIPARGETSGVLYAEPFFLPVDQTGTVTFTSDQPVSAVALLVGATSANSVNSYVPIMNPYDVNNRQVAIPQVVDGGGWTTHFYLVNPSEDAMTGEIRLYKNGEAGQPGVPWEIVSEQGVNSVFAYTIEPRSIYTLVGRGETGDITTGFAEIVQAAGTNSPHAFAIINFANLATTVEGSSEGKDFRMYVEISGTFPEELAATPALTLANSADSTATVNLKLYGLDGSDSGLSGVLTLPPKGHVSAFLYQVPGFENLPTPYAGVLRVTTQQPGVTFAGFRGRWNEQSQFLITATGPLKELGNMNPIIFPHLVDGGGFATQFILIPGSTGAGSSGTIRYLDPSGSPLNVAIAPE